MIDLHKSRPLTLVVLALAMMPLLLAMRWFFQHVAAEGSYGTMVFATYWASGNGLAHGLDPFTWLPETYSGYVDGKLYPDLNLNPPSVLPFAQLIALLPLTTSARLWIGFTTLFFIAAILFIGEKGKAPLPKVVWALFLPAFSTSIMLGQNYAIMMGLVTAVWYLIRTDRQDFAAVALGLLVAFKPNFGLAMVAALAGGYWRFAIRAGVVAAVATVLPVFFYGFDIHLKWLAAMKDDFHHLLVTNAALASWLRRLGLGVIAIPAVIGLGVVGMAIVRRNRLALSQAVVAGFAMSILCSPLAWFHYLILFVPFLMTQRWNLPIGIAAVTMLVGPEVVADVAKSGAVGAALASAFYTVQILLVLVGTLWAGKPDRRETRPLTQPAFA